MNRVYFKNILLIILLCFGCFSCSFNSAGRETGRISFAIPDSDIVRNAASNEDVLSENPEYYSVKIVYADGTSIYEKNHKAGDVIILDELASGQYDISIRGETPNYIFTGNAIANVLEEEDCAVELEIQAWKKGQIKLDFADLEKTNNDVPNLSDFTATVLDSSNKNVYEEKIPFSSIGSDHRYMLGQTFPVGNYTVKLKGGNPDCSYRVNKDLKINVSEGKIFVCHVSEHEAINFFISSSGSDESGTGDVTSPFRTVNKALSLMKDINVLVRITIVDSVVENNPVNINNGKFRVTFDGKTGSSLIAKGGINISAGNVTLDNGVVISGGKQVTVGSGCKLLMKGSAKIEDDTPVMLQSGAVINIADNLTGDSAAVIKMAVQKNKTSVISCEDSKPDLLKNNYNKFKFDKSQSYNIKEDGKAWAVIPAGYMGIDEAINALKSAATSSVKLFADDNSELNQFGSELKTSAVSGVDLSLKTNPQVTSIDSVPFKGSSKLKTVIIPSTIITVGTDAFNGCTNLTSVTFENGVKNIGTRAFNGCTSLSKADFSESIKSIGDSAFANCSGLKNINFNNGVTSIGPKAFFGSGLNGALVIPESVNVIGNEAFSGTKITALTLKEGLNSIGDSAFKNTVNLNSSLVMPASLRVIGNNAFEGSNITGVSLNTGLATLGNSAFKGCSKLAGEVIIPGSVRSFGTDVFSGCTLLNKAVIEKGVSLVSERAFENSGITDVVIADSVGSIRDSAFTGTNLNTVSIPRSVWGIYPNSFSNCKQLRSVELNEGLTSISSNAFNACNSLSDISIPMSVISIGSDVFAGTAINNVTFRDIKSKWDKNGGGILNPGLSGGKIAASEVNAGCARPLNLDEARSRIKNGGNIKVFVGDDTEIRELGKIISNMRGGSLNLDLRTDLKVIPSAVFANCSYMTAISIPEGVESIEQDVFANDIALKTVKLPSSINSISRNAFIYCKILESVTFADSSKTWHVHNIFSNQDTDVTVSNGVLNASNLNSAYVQYDWRVK